MSLLLTEMPQFLFKLMIDQSPTIGMSMELTNSNGNALKEDAHLGFLQTKMLSSLLEGGCP